MRRPARIFTLVAALLMSVAFVFPLWRISLIAPQYPEGLGMLIRINNIVGIKENDLNSINGLNHYIGMARIEPDGIPELRFMPAILGTLIVVGLLVAASGKRAALVVWAVMLVGVFTGGLYDFWRWGYEYGHNLADDAIIKIPGMSYQPPLIGPKQLLNFRATSWPDIGGWALVIAAGLVAYALLPSFKHTAAPPRSTVPPS